MVSHDLGVVARVADRVAVMYAGKIVEIGTAEEVYYDPRHPYTWGLMRSLPAFVKGKEQLYTIPGMPPTLIGGLATVISTFIAMVVGACHVSHLFF